MGQKESSQKKVYLTRPIYAEESLQECLDWLSGITPQSQEESKPNSEEKKKTKPKKK